MIDVLVIDDDVYVGEVHCRYVDAVPGFRALAPVRDLASARRAVAENPVDLLLVDGILPDGNGIDLVRETEVDALVLSAVTSASTVRSALRAGALGYVFKPFEATYLQRILRRYARYRRFWEQETLTQADLDGQLHRFHDLSSTGARHGGGGGSSTRENILGVLDAAAGPLTAVEIAEAVGISRATAQRHLAKLAGAQSVTVSLQYGSTGRPEHLYGTS